MQAYKEETKPISDPFAEEEETEELPAAEEPETTLTRKEDGTYCWKSEMDLKRDNWMLGFLMKAILIPSAVLFLGALVFTLSSGTPIRNILMGYGVLLAVLGVVAVGYGATQGVQHKLKPASEVSAYEGVAPQWFNNGVEAALLPPTALNKLSFFVKGQGNKVALTYKEGAFAGVDKGLVKYHFELGAGKENFEGV